MELNADQRQIVLEYLGFNYNLSRQQALSLIQTAAIYKRYKQAVIQYIQEIFQTTFE